MTIIADTRLDTAETILAQLGGREFTAMTGATHIVVLNSGVQFSFKGSAVANKCRIVLHLDDTYRIEFFKIRGADCDQIGRTRDFVYADMLQAIFTSVTGLDCTL